MKPSINYELVNDELISSEELSPLEEGEWNPNAEPNLLKLGTIVLVMLLFVLLPPSRITVFIFAVWSGFLLWGNLYSRWYTLKWKTRVHNIIKAKIIEAEAVLNKRPYVPQGDWLRKGRLN